MKEKFEDRTITGTIKMKVDKGNKIWEADKETIVNAIIDIAEEYQADGYVLTLRQLYYQLVKANVIPNFDEVYAKISAIKDDVVYSGLVDWDAFEDRGRLPHLAYYEDDVKSALQKTVDSYALDRQLNQRQHVEVWSEKDAISSILKRVTTKYTIRLVINKGYSSSTAMYGAYERFMECLSEGKQVTILYFGDHDPSGLDMVRDIRERIMGMMLKGKRKRWVEQSMANWQSEMCELDELPEHIQHIGLTKEQIKLYNPPPNPAKITDPRAKGYLKEHGPISWEVDALKPSIMVQIVENAIQQIIDMNEFNDVMERENDEVVQIQQIVDNIDHNK